MESREKSLAAQVLERLGNVVLVLGAAIGVLYLVLAKIEYGKGDPLSNEQGQLFLIVSAIGFLGGYAFRYILAGHIRFRRRGDRVAIGFQPVRRSGPRPWGGARD